MPNRSTDALFQLIKSLEKSEKRNFKLFAKRNSSSGDLKTTQLFDALDKMSEYDDLLDPEGRSYKNTMKMMMEDGLFNVLPKSDDAWIRFLNPFLRLTRKEKNKRIIKANLGIKQKKNPRIAKTKIRIG